MPTEPVSPNGVARPCAAAALVYSPAVRPGWAQASRALRVDVEPLHGGQVEHDAVVDGAVARDAVAAAADGELHARVSRARTTVRATSPGAGGPHDHRGPAVVDGVVDLPGGLVVGPPGRSRSPWRSARKAARSKGSQRGRGGEVGTLPRPCSLRVIGGEGSRRWSARQGGRRQRTPVGVRAWTSVHVGREGQRTSVRPRPGRSRPGAAGRASGRPVPVERRRAPAAAACCRG